MAKIKIKNLKQFVYDNILELETGRCGQIKVDVSKVFKKSPNGEKLVLGAYHNYLGGGMIGRCVGASMFHAGYLSEKDQELFEALKDAACEVLHSEATGNDEYIEENHGSFEFNQRLPASAY